MQGIIYRQLGGLDLDRSSRSTDKNFAYFVVENLATLYLTVTVNSCNSKISQLDVTTILLSENIYFIAVSCQYFDKNKF